MKKGKIVQVLGPVVDVEFESSDLPYIKDALEVENNGKKCVMTVRIKRFILLVGFWILPSITMN